MPSSPTVGNVWRYSRASLHWGTSVEGDVDTTRLREMADQLDRPGMLLRLNSDALFEKGIYNGYLMAQDFEDAASDLRKLADAVEARKRGDSFGCDFDDFDRQRLGRNLQSVGEHLQGLVARHNGIAPPLTDTS